ncbi:MAG: hypothetical protein KGI06_00545 [Candidatus Micrarchaeota archaeon]|nr:hypothetical protein [Candidatus Micrarchaeota archaeon]
MEAEIRRNNALSDKPSSSSAFRDRVKSKISQMEGNPKIKATISAVRVTYFHSSTIALYAIHTGVTPNNLFTNNPNMHLLQFGALSMGTVIATIAVSSAARRMRASMLPKDTKNGS